GGGGAVDVVGRALPGGGLGRGVEQQPRGARVPVAGLANRARVDEPLAARHRGALAAAPGLAGRRLAVGAREAQRDVRVADQADALVLRVEAQLRKQRAEDVLPDGVARTGVEQPDLALLTGRLQAREPVDVVAVEHLL